MFVIWQLIQNFAEIIFADDVKKGHKTKESEVKNRWFSNVFRGYINKTMGQNGLSWQFILRTYSNNCLRKQLLAVLKALLFQLHWLYIQFLILYSYWNLKKENNDRNYEKSTQIMLNNVIVNDDLYTRNTTSLEY